MKDTFATELAELVAKYASDGHDLIITELQSMIDLLEEEDEVEE